jgi:signal transduction histidine kinase/pSer/pThr/pTyr-binding forkhead associated (FHA) protein
VKNHQHISKKAYLIPYPIESFAKPIAIKDKQTFIGRSHVDGFQIKIDDKHISRKHACIRFEGSTYSLEDLDSQNGTFLNNERIKKAPLHSHDKISVGNLTFLFLLQPKETIGFISRPSERGSDTIDISLEEIDFTDIWAQNADHAARGFLDHRVDQTAESPQRDMLAHERISLLYQLSEILRSTGDATAVYEKGVELVMQAMPDADYALIASRSRFDDSFNIMSFKSGDHHQRDADKIPISHTVFDWVLTEKVTLVSENLVEDQRFQESESISVNDMRSIVCAPINGKNGVIGLLYAQANNLMSPFTKNDAKFISAVANELALNIDNIHLNKELLRNESMAAIGLTVSNLAHNIKNLLAVQQTASQLMDVHIKENDFTRIAKKWQWIKDSLAGIGKLSSDMLEFVKEDKLHNRPVDVNKLILANRPLFDENLLSDHVEFEYALTRKDTTWILDEVHLQQALLNLVMNAVDACQKMQAGRIRIGTAVHNEKILRICVEDNGCGIPENSKGHILDLFYTSKGSKGTGLGLPMVQKFVERSGGQLEFQSEENKGSIFTMIFPQTP